MRVGSVQLSRAQITPSRTYFMRALLRKPLRATTLGTNSCAATIVRPKLKPTEPQLCPKWSSLKTRTTNVTWTALSPHRLERAWPPILFRNRPFPDPASLKPPQPTLYVPKSPQLKAVCCHFTRDESGFFLALALRLHRRESFLNGRS